MRQKGVTEYKVAKIALPLHYLEFGAPDHHVELGLDDPGLTFRVPPITEKTFSVSGKIDAFDCTRAGGGVWFGTVWILPFRNSSLNGVATSMLRTAIPYGSMAWQVPGSEASSNSGVPCAERKVAVRRNSSGMLTVSTGKYRRFAVFSRSKFLDGYDTKTVNAAGNPAFTPMDLKTDHALQNAIDRMIWLRASNWRNA